MSQNILDMPLPYGWVKQWDESNQRNYYVDTKANPPRSIWVHPYEDEQYLETHPETRAKLREAINAYPPPAGPPPPPGVSLDRRHSYGGRSASPYVDNVPGAAPGHKRGFFERLKDKLNSAEEREAQRYMSGMSSNRPQYVAQSYGAPAYGQGYPQQNVYYGQQPMMPMGGSGIQAGPSQRRGGGGGGGGMALPLLGGLAGGMILGDMMSDIDHLEHDQYNDYGGSGGGFDNGGGDFGGGGFEGGF